MLDIQNKGYMLEPWWEEVKHRIRIRTCLCSKQEWLRDGRPPESHTHAN